MTMYETGVKNWRSHRMTPRKLNETIQKKELIQNSRTQSRLYLHTQDTSKSAMSTTAKPAIDKFRSRSTLSKLIRTNSQTHKKELELKSESFHEDVQASDGDDSPRRTGLPQIQRFYTRFDN